MLRDTPLAFKERIEQGRMGDLAEIMPRWQPWVPPKQDQAFQQVGCVCVGGWVPLTRASARAHVYTHSHAHAGTHARTNACVQHACTCMCHASNSSTAQVYRTARQTLF
eukprot:1159192-Pelagomonas_calceolata.AAC.3